MTTQLQLINIIIIIIIIILLRYHLAGDALKLVAYRLRWSFIFATWLATQLQTVQFPYLHNWKVFKECGEGGVGGYSPGQCMLHDSATTTCSKTHITYITVTVSAPDVQNSTAIVS